MSPDEIVEALDKHGVALAKKDPVDALDALLNIARAIKRCEEMENEYGSCMEASDYSSILSSIEQLLEDYLVDAGVIEIS